MKKSIVTITIFLTLFVCISSTFSATLEDAQRYNAEGVYFYNKADFNSALKNWEKGLDICRELGNKQCIGIFLNNIGLVYDYLDQYDKALSYYEKALVIHKEIGNLDGIYRNAGLMGKSYEELKKYNEAVDYYKMSIEVAEKIRDELKSEEYRTSFMVNEKEGLFFSPSAFSNKKGRLFRLP